MKSCLSPLGGVLSFDMTEKGPALRSFFASRSSAFRVDAKVLSSDRMRVRTVWRYSGSRRKVRGGVGAGFSAAIRLVGARGNTSTSARLNNWKYEIKLRNSG